MEVNWEGTVEVEAYVTLLVPIGGYAAMSGDEPTEAEIEAAKQDALDAVKKMTTSQWERLIAQRDYLDLLDVDDVNIKTDTVKG